MKEVRLSERRVALQDLMYISILEKFFIIGVDMLPRMDGKKDSQKAFNARLFRSSERRRIEFGYLDIWGAFDRGFGIGSRTRFSRNGTNGTRFFICKVETEQASNGTGKKSQEKRSTRFDRFMRLRLCLDTF